MGTKQLRLDVAQLTDVGRKREHNEDNMAYVIPKDQQVMAKKGALFIVADGMGGHAAGEVASEIAVDTVSNVYYQDDSDDVAVSLLHAIKRANALIHQRAAENMLRSGMGTTCVAAVLRGNMAYIANVGDSRAYLVHSGQVKQVSQDHSWVAEQVRAGLLTEDQARTHAQRNVITRCLGTQADVEIDVFPEPIEEKDALVLCTDGLSGLVSDDEIRRIVDQSGPQESVYHLVERANENGGPDNITAIVVSVLEVGAEPPNTRHPVYAGGREVSEDTIVLGGIASASTGTTGPSTFDNGPGPSGPLRFPSGPLVSPDSVTAPQPVVLAPSRKRSRLFYPTLALLILFVIALLAGGGYYFLRTNSDVANQHLQDAKRLIDHAGSEVKAHPATALQDLASAQNTLRSLQNVTLTTAQHNKLMNLLQKDLTTEVKAAIMSYNAQQAITPLPCSHMQSPTTLSVGTTGTQAKTVALVQGKNNTSQLYASGQDEKLYQVTNTGSLLPLPLPSPLANARILDIAGYGPQLALLTQSPNGTATSYTLALFSPDQKKLQTTSQINPDLITNGQTPKLLAVAAPDVYVVLAADATQSAATILDYAPNKVHQPLSLPPTKSNLSVSVPMVSMAALPQHQLFFLLADGSMLAFAGGTPAATQVFVRQAIAQPLAVSASDFTWTKTVPVATAIPGGTPPLSVAGATSPRTLVAVLVNAVPHLYVLDASLHRVLSLQVLNVSPGSASVPSPTSGATPTSTSTGGGVVNGVTSVSLRLERQYVSPALLAQEKSMVVDDQSSQVTILAQTQQNASSMLSLVSFNTSSQDGCV